MSLIEKRKAKKLIKQAKHILLLTDERIDGDTIGSTLGMYHVLEEMGKHVEVYSPNPLPKMLEFVPGTEVIQRDAIVFEQETVDLVMVFDCADGKYFQEDYKKLKSHPPLICFDHHATNPFYGTLNFIEPDAASAADVVWRFLDDCSFKLNKNAAQSILTGICTDTVVFSTSNTTAACLTAAHELAKYGAKMQEIVTHTMMRRSVPSLKLWGLAFERLYKNKTFGALATVILRKDLENLKAEEEDVTGLSNFLNAMIEDAEIVMVLRETDDGGVKASLRSHTKDVAALAQKFGGGGHVKAAGFKISNASLEKVEGVWQIVKKDGRIVE